MIFKTIKERPIYSYRTSEMLLSRAGKQFAGTFRASCTQPSMTSPSSGWGQAAPRSLGTAGAAAGASAAVAQLSQPSRPFSCPPAQLLWTQSHTQTEEEEEGQAGWRQPPPSSIPTAEGLCYSLGSCMQQCTSSGCAASKPVPHFFLGLRSLPSLWSQAQGQPCLRAPGPGRAWASSSTHRARIFAAPINRQVLALPVPQSRHSSWVLQDFIKIYPPLVRGDRT